jgi:hypothetical protein
MFCTYCRAPLQPDQRYCGTCGNPAVGNVPLPPAAGRVASHARTLGMLWIAFSALHLLRGGGVLLGARMMRLIDHTWSDDLPWAWPVGDVFNSFLSFLGVMAVLMAVTGFLAGLGLLERRPWARSLAIVLAVIALLHPPLGTALGIYTLWVLLPAQSEEEYRRTARPA